MGSSPEHALKLPVIFLEDLHPVRVRVQVGVSKREAFIASFSSASSITPSPFKSYFWKFRLFCSQIDALANSGLEVPVFPSSAAWESCGGYLTAF